MRKRNRPDIFWDIFGYSAIMIMLALVMFIVYAASDQIWTILFRIAEG